MISGANYPSPVSVNGYSCRNCAEVDLAKRHIDPSHPGSGPFDVNAAHDPTRSAADPKKVAAAKATADAASKQVVGYSAKGARMGEAPPGALLTLAA